MNRTLQIIFLLLFISKSGFSQHTGSTFNGGLLVLNATESKRSTKSAGTVKEEQRSTLNDKKQAEAAQTTVSQQSTEKVDVNMPAEIQAQAASDNMQESASTDQSANNTNSSINAEQIAASLPLPQEEVGVIFYPNPVRDNLTVQFPQRGTHTVKVFNIIGEKVAEKTVVDEDIVTLNLSSLQTGVLFLSYEYGGKVYTKKFSKN